MTCGLILLCIRVCVIDEFKHNLKCYQKKKKGFHDQRDETVIRVLCFAQANCFLFSCIKINSFLRNKNPVNNTDFVVILIIITIFIFFLQFQPKIVIITEATCVNMKQT